METKTRIAVFDPEAFYPFDGNKLTGFLVGVLFREMNGFRFTTSEEDVTQAILGRAAGSLKESAFAAWLRSTRNQAKNRRAPPDECRTARGVAGVSLHSETR